MPGAAVREHESAPPDTPEATDRSYPVARASRCGTVGLAPAAHGGNRTGRIFTGDPSGDVLYRALHAVGLASQPTSIDRGDGLVLHRVRITVPVHCAPPDNRPTTLEADTCRPWLARELELLAPTLKAVVALGGFAWHALLPVLATADWPLPKPRPTFGHGRHVVLTDPRGDRELQSVGLLSPQPAQHIDRHAHYRDAPRHPGPCRPIGTVRTGGHRVVVQDPAVPVVGGRGREVDPYGGGEFCCASGIVDGADVTCRGKVSVVSACASPVIE
jgi:uracil-DNA glycosylase